MGASMHPHRCIPVLQDPPAFTVRPKEEYFQEVGRELVIPCAAHGDPSPTITWMKVGAAARGTSRALWGGGCCFWPLGHPHPCIHIPAEGAQGTFFVLL